ncbi:hypothetical protein BS47DRAFT_1388537 [Hydnum rufescens UP504]|uniref:Uncharacterized protein n=1 Tax=Hydnum rufescens UP504 TaxID=1448309 RepID=A0A9P6B817_9AGAM|nr:hypothetical protein BS47DRAFT_1388537 [Hydnum rufescens UP504]
MAGKKLTRNPTPITSHQNLKSSPPKSPPFTLNHSIAEKVLPRALASKSSATKASSPRRPPNSSFPKSDEEMRNPAYLTLKDPKVLNAQELEAGPRGALKGESSVSQGARESDTANLVMEADE